MATLPTGLPKVGMGAPKRSVATQQVQDGFTLSFGAPTTTAGRRVVIYGEGGVGKTTLCASLPGKTAFFDLDKSLLKLPNIAPALKSGNLVAVQGVETWEHLRGALRSEGWDGINNIVIDTMSVVEILATEYVLNTTRSDKGVSAKSIEDYGYGKGYRYVQDAFELLLSDIEKHTDAGRNVVMVCHSVIQQNTDPENENFPRYEPKLMHSGSGKVSIRLRVRDWADDVLFVSKNRVVNDGKAVSDNTRILYTADMGWCMAKSRAMTEPVRLDDAEAFWAQLFN